MALTRKSCCLALAILVPICFSELANARDPERGVEFSILWSSFFGGDSGPTVPGGPLEPETRYQDTFGPGFGVTAQYFRQFHSNYRWQAGLLYQNWPGEFFEGGELQPGWEFGAGGKFDDLTITGVYGGITAIRQPGAKLRPFASIDLAIVRLPELSVVVSGESRPYWKDTLKDYLLIKGGVAYEISATTTLTLDAGFSVLGQPENVNIYSSGTAGSALVVGIGVSYRF